MSKEVIAVLMPGKKQRKGAADGVQALVRLEDGQFAVEDVADTGIFKDSDVARFRQALAIKDPETREVIGYEMEPVRKVAG